MKLGSLREGGRDGTLVVINADLTRIVRVPHICTTLQAALDKWQRHGLRLQETYRELCDGAISGEPFVPARMAAPLPRAYQWLDGSAYMPHVRRVRQARGAQVPERWYDDPLMYQGGSDVMLGAHDPIVLQDESWGGDCEAEIAVIVDDVPRGTRADQAQEFIRLIVLVNDISLRGLIPAELEKGFGFLHGKPPSAFAPAAVTPDELGNAWRDAKVHLPLLTRINGTRLGEPHAGEDMQFNFAQLIAHAAKTRPLSAGTIIGSGTVSNEDESRGVSCLMEQRVMEQLREGRARTAFLRGGDRVRIEMTDAQGGSVFGAIEQTVELCPS